MKKFEPREGDYLFPADLFELTPEQRIEVGRELIRQRGIETVNLFFTEIARRNALLKQKGVQTDNSQPEHPAHGATQAQ